MILGYVLLLVARMRHNPKVWIIPVLALAICFLSGCSKNEFKEFNMRSASMEPTLPQGSIAVVDTNAYKEANPERFDIIVFEAPSDSSEYGSGEAIFCFRVVGLPGEQVKLSDKGVFVDSELLDLPDGLEYRSLPYGPRVEAVDTLSGDEYFVLGDNTDNANDSRHWGPLNRDKILGKVIDVKDK